MSEKFPLNVKIKEEKLTPERDDDTDPDDEIDRFLNSRPFGGEEDEKKDLEPAKTSDELLQELFGAIGAKDIFFKDDSKKKKKKKRKHSDDDGEGSSKKSKKSKKAKKIKQEIKSEGELSDDIVKKIKKEKKDKEREREVVMQKKKLSIIIKDFKLKPSDSSSRDKHREKSKEKDRNRDKDKERTKDRKKDHKKRSRDKKSGSDFSLSDEETYRNFYDYHMSSRWYSDDYRRDDRVRDWDRDKYQSRSRYDDRHSRYESSRNYNNQRSRSRSRSRKHSPIDKKKLLEIARKNAISMLKNGMLPRISDDAKEKMIAKIRHGGKTIVELTNYCQKLSRAEDLGELSDLSDSEVDGEGLPRAFHHPFEVKDRGPIVMNIRNSIPIAPKQASELKAIMSQFPVSSGKQHSLASNDTWIPVTTSSKGSTTTTSTTTTTAGSSTKSVVTLSKQIQEQLPELAKPKTKTEINPVLTKPYDWKNDNHYCKSIELEQPPCDVSEIISQRLNAMRKLQDNPNDVEATKTLYETQQNMTAWATSKYTPGQFLGSTEVQVLTQKELAGGGQAWARRDQLLNTAPVTSGMGMHLLRKMGWTPGQGLGLHENGGLQPLLLELKLDKRGLEANEEILRGQKGMQGKAKRPGGGGGGPRGRPAAISMDALMQKHPVSLLGELASKRKWGAPNYSLVNESGPPHAKNFIFKIRLNGIDYTCPVVSNNKKDGKSAVARFTLQQLGILPP